MTAGQNARISKLPLEQQIREYGKRKAPHPKMFTNIVRNGMMSKEKQQEFDNYYNTGLRNRVKLQIAEVERANYPQARSYSNQTPLEENEKNRKEVEELRHYRQPAGEDGFAQAPSDSSSTDHEPQQDDKVDTMIDLDI